MTHKKLLEGRLHLSGKMNWWLDPSDRFEAISLNDELKHHENKKVRILIEVLE